MRTLSEKLVLCGYFCKYILENKKIKLMFCLEDFILRMKIEYFIGDLVHLHYFLLSRKAWKGKCIHFHEMDRSCKPFLLGLIFHTQYLHYFNIIVFNKRDALGK